MRKIFRIIVAFTALAQVGLPRDAAAQQPASAGSPALLLQVQAADVLSDLITYTNSRAATRARAMQDFLSETGQLDAFRKSGAAPGENKLLPFSEIYRGAVLFVQGDGAKYADPSLRTLNDSQLASELTELQVYNIEQFKKLNQQVRGIASMKSHLESAGQWDAFVKWAAARGITPAKPPATPEEAAARMEEMVNTAHELAWEKAQARGMTREEFDRRWAEQVKNYRESVAQQVTGVRALANSLTNPPPPPPPPPANPPPVLVGPPPGLRGGPGGGPSLPPTGQSPYTAQSFQQRNDELWHRFDD